MEKVNQLVNLRVIRKIKFHKNYFTEFHKNLDGKVQEKVEYVFYIIRHSRIIPAKFLKSLEGTEGWSFGNLIAWDSEEESENTEKGNY